MIAVGGYTSVLRLRRRVYATGEDYRMQGMEPETKTDEEIERVRRAHQNDLENILPFFGVGLFYALSGPSMLAAQISFIGFTLARILHSLFYIRGLQPYRTLAFMGGWVLLIWMTVAGIVAYL